MGMGEESLYCPIHRSIWVRWAIGNGCNLPRVTKWAFHPSSFQNHPSACVILSVSRRYTAMITPFPFLILSHEHFSMFPLLKQMLTQKPTIWFQTDSIQSLSTSEPRHMHTIPIVLPSHDALHALFHTDFVYQAKQCHFANILASYALHSCIR